MICPKCGSYVSDNTRFCSRCGKDFGAHGNVRHASASPVRGHVHQETHTKPHTYTTFTVPGGSPSASPDGSGGKSGSNTADFFSDVVSTSVEKATNWYKSNTAGKDSKNVILALLAAVGITIAIIVSSISSCVDNGFDAWNDDPDTDSDTYVDEDQYYDINAALMMNGWKYVVNYEHPVTGLLEYSSYIRGDSDSGSELYILGSTEDAHAFSILTDIMSSDSIDKVKASEFITGIFAELKSDPEAVYTLGPADTRVDGGFDFEVLTDSIDTYTLTGYGNGDDYFAGEVSSRVMTADYVLHNNESIRGTFYLVAAWDGTPRYLLAYSVLGESAAYADEKQTTLDAFEPEAIAWYSEDDY